MSTLDVFFDPRTLFKELESRPQWLIPFIIVSVIAIICTLLMFPVMEHLMLRQMPEGLSVQQQTQMLSSLKMTRYIGLLSAPVVLLMKMGLMAFLLYGVTVLFSFDFTYRKALSILSHASIIAALDGLIMVATIYFRGMNEIQSPKDLGSAVLSLSWLFGATLHPAMRAVLDSLTFFSVWYWVLLFIGIKLTTKLSKVKAFLIVAILWGIQTGFSAGMAMIFSRYSAASV